MTEGEAKIRESLLNTLSFLASETQQRDFAAKVFYSSYQGEFACWWFDTFYPEESSALQMFTPAQLTALKRFSETFDQNLNAIGHEKLPIKELQAKPEWQRVVACAQKAKLVVQNAS